MNSMVLQSADHLQARAVTYVRQTGIPMTAEIPLQDLSIACAIEKGTPGFQFADARRRFLCVQFRHPPLTQILPAAHRVSKVNAPIVAIVDIAHRRGDAPLGHDGVRFAEEGFRNESNSHSGSRSLNRCSQPGATSA